MSKNERYNVSQHDGITEGPWKWDKGILCNDNAIDPNYGTKGFDILELDGRFVLPSNANKTVIAAIPDILNALKEAYEEIDRLRRAIDPHAE